MAISTTLQVSQIAFRWSGNIRVLKCSKLKVTYDEDKQAFIAVDGKKVTQTEGYYLKFAVDLSFFEQVSGNPTSWREIINTINAGTVVDFYPIYSLDVAVLYPVIIPVETGKEIIDADDWGRFLKRRTFTLEAESRISTLPSWITD